MKKLREWLTREYVCGVSNVDIVGFLILVTMMVIGCCWEAHRMYGKLCEARQIPAVETIVEPTSMIPEIEVPKCAVYQTIEVEPVVEDVVKFTQEEIDLLARVVMSEASILTYDEKKAVAEVILNRVDNPNFPNTVVEVVYQPNQFSTADNGAPDGECYDAVLNAIAYRSYPTDMLWFRQDRVDYGYLYMHIVNSNTVFSTVSQY